jgi:hypothetical protein
MHIVSTVTGTLAEEKTGVDALFATFPAGTLSGAPKPRAMEIIESLEPHRRGLYGGAIGYLDFTGNVDTCIAIRTALIYGGRAYVQAGAGIVADSDPQSGPKCYVADFCHTGDTWLSSRSAIHQPTGDQSNSHLENAHRLPCGAYSERSAHSPG